MYFTLLERFIEQSCFFFQLFSVKGKSNTPKETLRVQLAEQILSASTQDLKKPQFVFRPPPLQQNGEELLVRLKKEPTFELKYESYVMIEVFKFLGSVDLSRCASVCKAWNSIVQVRQSNCLLKT